MLQRKQGYNELPDEFWKGFSITFPSQIPSLWDIQCFLWDLIENKVKFSLVWTTLLFVNVG